MMQAISSRVRFRETPFGYDHEVVYDSNDEFQVSYDENGCVNFILCNAEDGMSLNGKVLNDEIFFEDVLAIAKEAASDVEEDEVGFTSNQLGFGACAYYDEDDEDEVARIESIQVAVKNYWRGQMQICRDPYLLILCAKKMAKWR